MNNYMVLLEGLFQELCAEAEKLTFAQKIKMLDNALKTCFHQYLTRYPPTMMETISYVKEPCEIMLFKITLQSKQMSKLDHAVFKLYGAWCHEMGTPMNFKNFDVLKELVARQIGINWLTCLTLNVEKSGESSLCA